jgi:ferredoxin
LKKYFIVADGCIRCGSCLDACKFDAVQKLSEGRRQALDAQTPSDPAPLSTATTEAKP